MDLNTFTKETLQALTKSGGSDIVFNYQVKHKKDNAVELVWKRHVPAEDITVSYFLFLPLFLLSLEETCSC